MTRIVEALFRSSLNVSGCCWKRLFIKIWNKTLEFDQSEFWVVGVAPSLCYLCMGWVVVCALLFSWLGRKFMLRIPSLNEREGNMLLSCSSGEWAS